MPTIDYSEYFDRALVKLLSCPQSPKSRTVIDVIIQTERLRLALLAK